jgi:hypothetical protein
LVSLFPDYLLFETLCFHSLTRSFYHIPRLSDFAFRGCRHCSIFAFACLFCRLLVNVPFCCYTHLLHRRICWLLPLVLGFVLPTSSTRSERRSLAEKASIALSLETSSVEFLMTLQRCM